MNIFPKWLFRVEEYSEYLLYDPTVDKFVGLEFFGHGDHVYCAIDLNEYKSKGLFLSNTSPTPETLRTPKVEYIKMNYSEMAAGDFYTLIWVRINTKYYKFLNSLYIKITLHPNWLDTFPCED